jgi:cation diffusion facilitator family transporter
MVTLLSKIFIHDTEDKGKLRQAYGMLCGVIGILLNLMLCIGKFIAGTISNSIAITADAVNNLSDAGSSIVTLAGFKLAGAKADPEHPFGHGRIEYVSGLAVAAAILIMAYELIRDSIGKIIHPEETEFSMLVVAILVIRLPCVLLR